MGFVFAVFICAVFHILFVPPMWATTGLCTVLFVQYSIANSLLDNVEELINAK